MSHLFTIWSKNRAKKVFVIVPEGPNVMQRLINKASEKLSIIGSNLVLESNGTSINDDEVLILIKTEVLLLLSANEEWGPPDEQSIISSSASTLTVSSVNDMTDDNYTNNDTDSNENETTVIEIHENSITDSAGTNLISMNTPIIVDANLEYTWSHLDVPWSKIPANLLSILESATKWQNCKSAITEICHTIVHEMRIIKTRIPVIAFKQMANKIVAKYPGTFLETDIDGVVIGDGTYFLIRKLIDRNNYLNRPHKRGWESSPTPPKFRKKKMNSVAGCSHWEEPTGAIEDQTNQDKLKSLKESDEEYFDLLEKTYSDQRIFINNVEAPPTVKEIKQNWPALFQKSGVKWHFKKVTGIDLNNLKSSIEEKSEKILKFGCQKKMCDTEYDRSRKIEECLKFYGKYFKEDLSKVILIQPQNNNPNNVSDHISIVAPCILETDKEGTKYYKVFMEKEEIYEDTSFIESFLVCFGLYFVLNLVFPKEVASTLEMVQRFHLKIHPDSGTRAKSASKGKVLTLMKNLTKVFL